MRQLIFFACILFALFLTGCTPENTPPPTQTPTQIILTETASPEPTSEPTRTATSTPIPSITPSPTFTSSPKPSLTPTLKATSTPAAISPANVDLLEREAVYTLPIRGQLYGAEWAGDGKTILATTDIGAYLLDDTSLEQLEFYQGMAPITKLDGDRWLVWYEGERKYLDPGNLDYQILTANHLINEMGFALVARNGEIAVQKTSEDEVEIVSLKTGSRQSFNISEAGYYLEEMRPAAISPDGKILVIQDSYWSDLYFVNLETLEVAYKLSNIYDDPIFSPDSQFVLVTDNGGIKVLKAHNGIQINRFSDGFIVRPEGQHYIYYQAVAYTYLSDSARVGVIYCISNEKCELYIWSMATGQPETIVKGLPAGIQALDFTPSGKSFLTVSRDGKVQAWSMESQALLAESQPFDRAKAVVSPDGRLTAIPRGSQIEIYDVVTGELWMQVGVFQDVNNLMVDSITDKYLLVAGVDNSPEPFAELWDLSSGELVRKFNPLDYPNTHSNEAYCIHDQVGRYIVCGSDPLQIFDISTGALIYSNKSQDGKMLWAISPDGNTLATCTVAYTNVSYQGYDTVPSDQIYLLDLPQTTSSAAGVLQAQEGGICSPMVFSPDSQYLAAQSGYIWKLDGQQLQAEYLGIAEAPFAFSPDGSLLVSGNRVIDTATGKTLTELEVGGKVERIGFDPDGYHLVFKTNQGVEVWKVSGE